MRGKKEKTESDRRFTDYQNMSYYVTQIFHHTPLLGKCHTYIPQCTQQSATMETQQQNQP